jgi:prephenate dehydratase/chorismate mutase
MPQLRESSAESRPGEIAPELARLRRAIDAVDREILARLNERAALVKEVGALKRRGEAPVYVASRERDLVDALTRANPGPFPDAGLRHVFREIISATRSLEDVVRVAFVGPPGAVGHQAAVRQFGALIEVVPARSLEEVFALTGRGKAHYGIVPAEDALEGDAAHANALAASDLAICGELLLEAEEERGEAGRFFVVGRERPEPSGDDLTVLVFSARSDQSGALYGLLQAFARHDVNLAAIQSRPVSGRPWESLFFIEVEGHAEEEPVREALREAAAASSSHKILGSFPRAARVATPLDPGARP